MKGGIHNNSPTRVALIWGSHTLIAEREYSGLCREAGLHAGLTIRRFDVPDEKLKRDMLSSMKKWNPHGIITTMPWSENIARVRKWFPGIPCVALNRVPENCADSVVVASMEEITRLCHDHFIAHGARSVAFFFAGETAVTESITTVFRRAAPQGLLIPNELTLGDLLPLSPAALKKKFAAWFQSVPKPTGIVTVGTHCGVFLNKLCILLGWRIPKDIMLIGLDQEDECLSCTPHLSSICLPNEAVGAAGLNTLLKHLQPSQSPPPKLILVEGAYIIGRGSTVRKNAGSFEVATALSTLKADPGKYQSVTDMLKHTGKSSRRSFYRHFLSATGTTPGQALRDTKLKQACHLLGSTTLRITDIAEKCSYGSSSHFTQAFRRSMDMTPRDFRKKHTV